jgi:NADH-quinone oxidoreductase subunit H
MIFLLRKPFSTPTIRAMERELRRQGDKPEGLERAEPAFPTPPLPTTVGASKENTRA